MALFGGLGKFASTEAFAGWRWEGGNVDDTRDVIANESALALVCNGRPYVVMMATPQDLEDFVLGFCLTESIVRTPDEISSVRVRAVAHGIEANVSIAAHRFRELDRRQRNLTGRIGCGLCGVQTIERALRRLRALPKTASISPLALQNATAALGATQILNADTGAAHAAAWISRTGDIALVREDVGRHNALDKLVGAMIRERVDVRSGAVLITSRASCEMIQKAAAVGIEIVCAISAPTSLAIRFARDAGVTLVAFARGNRHTVYAHPDRLAYEKERIAV